MRLFRASARESRAPATSTPFRSVRVAHGLRRSQAGSRLRVPPSPRASMPMAASRQPVATAASRIWLPPWLMTAGRRGATV